jgi:glutamine synthetase adenylyltransferase
VENKLQMVHDAQTHSLPIRAEDLRVCARRLGYCDTDHSAAAEQFLHDYRQHTSRVNRIFESILGASGPSRFHDSGAQSRG